MSSEAPFVGGRGRRGAAPSRCTSWATKRGRRPSRPRGRLGRPSALALSSASFFSVWGQVGLLLVELGLTRCTASRSFTSTRACLSATPLSLCVSEALRHRLVGDGARTHSTGPSTTAAPSLKGMTIQLLPGPLGIGKGEARGLGP